MPKRHMLTTIDNPWNPWTHFNEWNAWDQQAGYYTLAFQARVVRTGPGLSDADQDLAIELAIEEIIHENVSGMHKRVPEPTTVASAA